MKITRMTIALAAALLSSSAVYASEFDGLYIGGKVGVNKSDITGANTASKQNATTYGIEEGYNWDMGGYLLGGSFFVDFNQKANRVTNIPPLTVYSGSTTIGLDLKLGLPAGNFLPYAKLGWDRTTGMGESPASQFKYTNDLHTGLGLEYKFAPSWSVAGEWTRSASKANVSRLRNDNFTLGLNYYFGTPVAPTPMIAAAPVVVKEEVKPAPAPVVRALPAVSKKTVFAADSSVDSLFDFGKADVKPAGKLAIDKFTADLKGADYEVIKVTGHTDRIGSKAFNQKLSTRRAEAVKAYMVESAGIPADKIEATGVDGSYPVTKPGECKGTKRTKKLIACLAPDRRVEVEVSATRTSK
jgi:OOP family OmpA-OmpF porin